MAGQRKAAVIDYGMGNLRSVLRAWQAVGADARLVDSPKDVSADDVLIFPGQGAIADTMRLLKQTRFDDLIKGWISDNKPFFGICLGLQALFEFSEEGGGVGGLGVFEGRVRRLNPSGGLKVPHMGWNNVSFKKAPDTDALLGGIDPDDQFYFVHSYCVETGQDGIVWGTTQYGADTFVSAVARGNLAACQFHPEKSQSKGLRLYRNFLEFLEGKARI